jgi:FkbM family methyltransferase
MSQATYQRRHTLPNGLAVAYQSLPELHQFYADIFEQQVYTRHGICLAAGTCVLDVGANIGMFTLFVALHCPGARILAVEPAPPLLALLEANVALLAGAGVPGARVEVIPCGLGRQAGTAPLTFYPHTSGMSSFYPSAGEERAALSTLIRNQAAQRPEVAGVLAGYAEELAEQRLRSEVWECPVMRLSDLLAERSVETVDLLKVDVEKSEMDVLAGIDEADWERVRQIVLEVHDLGDRLREVRRLLRARGYSVWMEQEDLYAGSDRHNVYAIRER